MTMSPSLIPTPGAVLSFTPTPVDHTAAVQVHFCDGDRQVYRLIGYAVVVSGTELGGDGLTRYDTDLTPVVLLDGMPMPMSELHRHVGPFSGWTVHPARL